MIVLDHTEPVWQDRFSKKAHTNGAATYSQDIVKHHLPVWSDILPEDAVISTCPLLDGLDVRGSIAVQYLHTYSYRDPLSQMRAVSHHLRGRVDHVVFVTAYRSLDERARISGYDSVFVPMVVDHDPVRQMATPEHDKHSGLRAVYFGNVTATKQQEHTAVVNAAKRAGFRVDTLSKNTYKGSFVSQEEAWRIVSRYSYGIGVGRCALEMMSLGLKVVLSGAHFGGIITTPDELAVQHGTNFNGRATTFDRDYAACLEGIDGSMDLTEVNDISLAIESIRKAGVREWSTP